MGIESLTTTDMVVPDQIREMAAGLATQHMFCVKSLERLERGLREN